MQRRTKPPAAAKKRGGWAYSPKRSPRPPMNMPPRVMPKQHRGGR